MYTMKNGGIYARNVVIGHYINSLPSHLGL